MKGKRKGILGGLFLAGAFASATIALAYTVMCIVRPSMERDAGVGAKRVAINIPVESYSAAPIIPEAEVEIGTVEVDEETLEMLALVIYQEAGGDACSDETRRMVGEVAMNRVADSRFPDTLEEVLLQKQQYGRLYWTGLAWPDRASSDGEAHAVRRAYDTARLVLNGDERLLPEDVIFQAEFPQGTETVAESDGFYFCR